MARPKGIPMSDEWKKAQSERLRKRWADRKTREVQSKKLKAVWSDPEKRKEHSERMRKVAADHPEYNVKTPEMIAKSAATRTGMKHPHTPEWNAKIAASNKGKKRSEEVCKRISEAKLGQKYVERSPEHTANQAEAQRGTLRSESQRKAQSDAAKAFYKTPEGKARAEEHAEHLRQKYADNPDKFQNWIDAGQAVNPKWHDTAPERAMAAILDEMGLEYEAQYRAKWLPKGYRNHKWDFCIPGMKTLVEVDGCYWHGCKEHYPDRWSDEQQNVEMQRDVRAEQAGWRVLRFWEHELFSDIEGIIDAMVA